MSTMYLRIKDIDGEATAKGHEKWIQIHTLHFHTQRILNTHPGRITNREGTRPAISEITLEKLIDKSSPLLFSESCVGKAKPEVQIDICQTASNLTPYLQITLNNVIVSGYDFRASDSTDPNTLNSIPTETIRLNFDKIELRYTPFNQQNEAQSPIPAGYDLKEAVAT